MLRRNTIILSLILLFGISLFFVYLNIFTREATQNKPVASSPTDETAQVAVSEEEKGEISGPDAKDEEVSTPAAPQPEKKEETPPSTPTPPPTPPKTTTTPPPVTPPPVITTPPPPTYKYKNGTFSATGNYFVPALGETESITINLTINNDVITGISTSYNISSPTSQNYSDQFDGSITGLVVSKKVDNVGSLSRVGGASYTTQGFNAAFNSVKAKALR